MKKLRANYSPINPNLICNNIEEQRRSQAFRLLSYIFVTILLVLFAGYIRDLKWVGNQQVHVLIEVVATMLAIFIGIIALVKYNAKKSNIFLILGLGFLGTALLDGYNAVTTSALLGTIFTNPSISTTSLSWGVSRIFLSLVMVVSLFVVGKEEELREKTKPLGKSVYLAVGIVGFIVLLSLQVFYPKLSFGGPEEYISAAIFLAALVGFYVRGKWKKSRFEYWLLFSLLLGFLAQAVFMPFSYSLFDPLFDAAHVLKGISYSMVLVGLIISICEDFGVIEKDKQELDQKNILLDALSANEDKVIIDNYKNVQDLTLFKVAVEETSDHIAITDSEGLVIYANKAAVRMTGYSKEETLGTKAGKLWGGLMDKEYYEKMWKTIKIDKKFFIGEVKNRRKSGEEYTAEVRISPILNKENQVLYFVAIERDITKAKNIDRMKTEFISLASHQLRTPLSAMRWFLEMLLSGDAGELNRQQREFTTNVNDSNNRMIDLVNALLNVSRIESGRIIIDPVPTDLNKLVDGVNKELVVKYKEKSQTPIVSIKEDLPEINIDPKLIRNVYMNLLTNAIKYSPENSEISIFISKSKDEIVSQISDNGFGIPIDQQSKVFEKFFRADNIQQKATDGNGLGLYLVKTIVESSGGRIWFKSEVNKGTTFWFTLPLKGVVAKQGEVSIDS